jgi:uncharacterized protein
MRIIVIPGMGCTPIEQCNWYAWFRDEIKQRWPYVQCELTAFPDPHQCRESIWLPFVQELIEAPGISTSSSTTSSSMSSNQQHAATIVVGHSSGAACAMRLLEQCAAAQTPLAGCILVAAAYTDLDDETERASQYFNRPWNWPLLTQGSTHKIVLFHGTNDQLIPVAEARHIAAQLGEANCDYRERRGESHFFRPFPELLQVVEEMLQ